MTSRHAAKTFQQSLKPELSSVDINKMCPRILLAPCLFLLLGCQSTARPKEPPKPVTPRVLVTPLPPIVEDPGPVAEKVEELAEDPAELYDEHRVIGRSRHGAALDVTILGDGPESILFLASIHGSEPAGTPILEQLAEHLRSQSKLLDGRRVLILPRANPDGLARRGRRARFNARGIDLNRNFPAANFKAGKKGRGRRIAPLSEPESRALYELIAMEDPARVISIHQPFACVDYDGPGAALAQAMSAACGLPVRKLGGRPGSLGSYIGIDLKRPVITLELPRGAEGLTRDILWKRYGPAMLVAVAGTASKKIKEPTINASAGVAAH